MIQLILRSFPRRYKRGKTICSFTDLAGWLLFAHHIDHSKLLQSDVSKMVKGVNFLRT